MSAIAIIIILLVVGAAFIAIMNGLKAWPLWIAVLLLAIAVAILMGGGESSLHLSK
jgi:hypothetical protein